MIDKPDKNEADTYNNRNQKKDFRQKPKGAGFALFIASLALFFAAAGIAAGYKHWQRMHDRAKDNARRLEVIELALPAKTDGVTLEKLHQEITDSISQHQTTTEQQLRKMAEMQTQTEQFAKTVTAQVAQITSLQSRLQQATAPKNEQDWQIAEVNFLLKLASRELQLSENPSAAISALTSADQRLSEIGSTNYLPVRQQIAKDLAALASVSPPDIAAISAQIDDLLGKLRPISTEKSNQKQVAPEQTATTNAESTDPKKISSLWSGYKEKMVSTLSDAILVSQIDKPITTALNVEIKEHLLDLIRLRLEALRLMALQQQDTAYHAQIKLLRDGIKQYFPPENTPELLTVLDTLDAINLKPEMPDISESLKQLNQTQLADVAKAKQ